MVRFRAWNLLADGLLYLGGAETVMGVSTAFAGVEGERGVYKRTTS